MVTDPAPSVGSMRSALSLRASIVPETLPSLMPTAAAWRRERGAALALLGGREHAERARP